VLFDNQIFVNQKFGGVSRYYTELFKHFDVSKMIDWRIIAFFSRNIYLNESFDKLVKFNVEGWDFKGSKRLINFLNKLLYYLFLIFKKLDINICHITYYSPYYLDKFIKKGVPVVVTVYDMIHEIYNGDIKTIQEKRYVINNADLILAISQSTANDIIKYYNVPKDRIVVTHLASSLNPDKAVYMNELPSKYILYIGLRDWYKNFNGFINAINPLIVNNEDLYVLCAGGPQFTKSELLLFKELGIENRVVWHPINNDSQLASFYKQALFFVFPSKYEGFGIPILEAMNCDCPVALSETSSLKEIADYAGFYFNPYSEESIKNACAELVSSSKLRDNLILQGKRRRKDFSWELTSQKTFEAYQKLVNA
jgi:glycosyltransferase involved in cell wall biosynthesis